MPNHHTTMCICSPGWDFDAEAFNKEHANTDLCQLVMPMPSELSKVHSGYWTINGKTVHSWKELDGKPVEVEENELMLAYGACNAYDWGCNIWGTKWGTYDVQAFHLGGDASPVCIKFQSAWCPPSKECLLLIAQWLCSTYRFNRIAFVTFDPYDDSTELHWTYDSPVVSED